MPRQNIDDIGALHRPQPARPPAPAPPPVRRVTYDQLAGRRERLVPEEPGPRSEAATGSLNPQTPPTPPPALPQRSVHGFTPRTTIATPTRIAKRRSFHLIRGLRSLVNKKRLAIVIGLIIVAGAGYLFMSRSPLPSGPTEVLSQNIAQTPDFSTLEPNNDASSTVSGQVAYDASKKVASYTDRIADISVTISQQQLPERFKADQAGQLAAFAQQINANQQLQFGDITAYAGLSIKGPQTVVFIKDGLLVFVAAEREVPKEPLTAYITSLR